MFTLAGFIDDCRAALEDATPELAVKDLLERTMARPTEVEAALGTPRRGFFAVPRSEWDPETLEERPFDIERARAVYARANARWAAEQARETAAPPAR
jgi:hypothetical protein